MRRSPSIHITEDVLASTLCDILEIESKEGKDIAKQVLMLTQGNTLSNRSVSITNDKMLKEIKKINSSTKADSDKLAQIIFFQRKKANPFIKQTRIKSGSRDYKALKEAAQDAANFCNAFNLDSHEGMNTYVKIGLSKMQNFNLNKLVSMYESICKDFQAEQELSKIGLKDKREQVEKIYNKYILEQTGIFEDDYSMQDKLCFAKVAQYCIQYKVPFEAYIGAQFKGMEYQKTYPYPIQLVGPKAIKRFSRYLKEYGLRVKR